MPAFVRALFIKSSTNVELSYYTKKDAFTVYSNRIFSKPCIGFTILFLLFIQ